MHWKTFFNQKMTISENSPQLLFHSSDIWKHMWLLMLTCFTLLPNNIYVWEKVGKEMKVYLSFFNFNIYI